MEEKELKIPCTDWIYHMHNCGKKKNPGGIDMKATGERIRNICQNKGITVKDIQEKLYIGSFQSVYAWFSGKTLPSLDNIYRLSKLMCVTIDEMIVGYTERKFFLMEMVGSEEGSSVLRISNYKKDYYKL